MPVVLAGAAIGQNITHQCGQPEGVVEFAIGEQTGVGGDASTVELLEPPSRKQAAAATFRVTLRVPYAPPEMS